MGQNLARAAGAHHASGMKHDEPVGVLSGQVEIVENGHNPNTVGGPVSGSPKSYVLVGQIEVVGGFVQQQVPVAGRKRFPDLRPGPGKCNPLLLAAGEHGERPVCKWLGPHVAERGSGDLVVSRLLAADDVRGAPHKHHIECRKIRLQLLLLGEKRPVPGHPRRRKLGKRGSINGDLTGRGDQISAGQEPQERRLAGAVGTNKGYYLPRANGKRHVLEDLQRSNGIAQTDSLNHEALLCGAFA